MKCILLKKFYFAKFSRFQKRHLHAFDEFWSYDFILYKRIMTIIFKVKIYYQLKSGLAIDLKLGSEWNQNWGKIRVGVK